MNTHEKTQWKGVISLLLTAFIWGTSFVAQSIGMEKIEAFTYNGIRTLMGGIFLLPVIIIKELVKKKKSSTKINSVNSHPDNISDKPEHSIFTKKALKSGIILGCIFCIASNFQQFAFYYSTAGKIALVTSLYMFFVPILGLFINKKVPPVTWICVVFGFIGLYFLCITPDQIGSINKGDFLALICAFVYAIHILCVEKFSKEVDGILLSCLQFFVGGTISIILMFIFETPDISHIAAAEKPLLYSGIMSCGIAYTFQIIGQKYTEATIASILMCMESAFAVLSSAVLLHEYLTCREIIGCVIMFVSIILSQLSTAKSNL